MANVHLVERDVKLSRQEYAGSSHDFDIDGKYLWKIAFSGKQADLFVETVMIRDIASRDGTEQNPYLSLPLFQAEYSDEQSRAYCAQQLTRRSTYSRTQRVDVYQSHNNDNKNNRNQRRRYNNTHTRTNVNCNGTTQSDDITNNWYYSNKQVSVDILNK